MLKSWSSAPDASHGCPRGAQAQYTQIYGVPAANTYYISPIIHTILVSGLKPETK